MLPDEAEKQRAEHFTGRGRDREREGKKSKNSKRIKKTQHFRDQTREDEKEKKCLRGVGVACE